YLAWLHPVLLLEARGLLLIGLGFLASLWVLAIRYWFRIPLAGISLALVLFAAACGLLLV
ncbi:LIC_13387 family protein, partial [Pseudomonas protegens]